jgi:hypothetical protein
MILSQYPYEAGVNGIQGALEYLRIIRKNADFSEVLPEVLIYLNRIDTAIVEVSEGAIISELKLISRSPAVGNIQWMVHIWLSDNIKNKFYLKLLINLVHALQRFDIYGY